MSSIEELNFSTRTLEEIISDIVANIKNVMERANVTPSQYLYQIIKIVAMREYEMQEQMRAIASMVSIPECTGTQLDRWGIECGIKRKDPEYATGEVRLTGAPNATSIPTGSIFTTNDGVEFRTTEEASLSSIIALDRDTDLTDVTPSPYSSVGGIDWCNTNADGVSGDAYYEGTDFTYEEDTLTWVLGHGPAAGSTYYIKVNTSISVDVAIAAVLNGTTGNVAANSITINSSAISGITSVDNPSETSGGTTGESDLDYRARLLKAKRRNFTLERVKAIAEEVSGVRNVKVRQDTSVDQTVSVDWTPLSGGSLATVPAKISTNYLSSSAIIQTFVPGERVVSIRKVTLYGQKVGDPPHLKVDLSYFTSGQAYDPDATPLATGTFDPDDVDPNWPTAQQDLPVDLKYGGFDRTRTYALVCTQSGADASNYWNLNYYSGYAPVDVDDPWRKGMYTYENGTLSQVDLNYDLAFKTHFGGASYTIQTAIDQNADWDTVSAGIEALLDYEEGQGFSPVGIQANIERADEVYISVQTKIYLSSGYTFATVASNIESNINTYINSLTAGDNVIWSKIMGIIMSEEGVMKCVDLTLQRDELDPVASDVSILEDEIAVLNPSVSGGTVFTYGGLL